MEKNQINSNGFAEGYWEHYYKGNNKLLAKGNYKNSTRVGYWEYYNIDGGVSLKEYFTFNLFI